jgi:hypothetical protein
MYAAVGGFYFPGYASGRLQDYQDCQAPKEIEMAARIHHWTLLDTKSHSLLTVRCRYGILTMMSTTKPGRRCASQAEFEMANKNTPADSTHDRNDLSAVYPLHNSRRNRGAFKHAGSAVIALHISAKPQPSIDCDTAAGDLRTDNGSLALGNSPACGLTALRPSRGQGGSSARIRMATPVRSVFKHGRECARIEYANWLSNPVTMPLKNLSGTAVTAAASTDQMTHFGLAIPNPF